ncbi:MAG: ABC transporter substrate-binding protein [Proteobacteria bacterium]|uniref:TetR family transcriptional regulator n=1 Tax=Aquabacterium sp. TaxID=1872578 RepID=UPI0035C7534B|nr:ABC transporter substrate-binding protein [Pseudomonadota bacterium]
MKRRSFTSLLASGLASPALISLGSATAHAQSAGKPATIRIGFPGAGTGGRPLPSSGFTANTVFRSELEQEFAADGIKIEWKYYVGAGPALNEAFANGLLDFCFGHGDLPLIVGRSTGLKHKILLSSGRGGDIYFITPATSTAKTVGDLQGKTLSVQKGTAGQLTMYRFLEKNGFTEPEKQFRIISQIRDDRVASLSTGDIAGAIETPFGLEARGVAKRLSEIYDDAIINRPGTVWVGEAFEQKHPDLVQRIVNRLVKVAHWSTQEANRETQYQLWTRSGVNTYIDNKRVWDRTKDLRTRQNPLLDDYYLASLQRSIDEIKRYRLIRRDVSIEGWIEPKYLNKALADQKLETFWPTQDANGKFLRT